MVAVEFAVGEGGVIREGFEKDVLPGLEIRHLLHGHRDILGLEAQAAVEDQAELPFAERRSFFYVQVRGVNDILTSYDVVDVLDPRRKSWIYEWGSEEREVNKDLDFVGHHLPVGLSWSRPREALDAVSARVDFLEPRHQVRAGFGVRGVRNKLGVERTQHTLLHVGSLRAVGGRAMACDDLNLIYGEVMQPRDGQTQLRSVLHNRPPFTSQEARGIPPAARRPVRKALAGVAAVGRVLDEFTVAWRIQRLLGKWRGIRYVDEVLINCWIQV